jgi:hypothetical protein
MERFFRSWERLLRDAYVLILIDAFHIRSPNRNAIAAPASISNGNVRAIFTAHPDAV